MPKRTREHTPAKHVKRIIIEDVKVEDVTPNEIKSTCSEDDSKWKYLPDIVLEKIFLLMKENDRFNAQFVCKRWQYLITNTATLWRYKRFKFSGRNPRDLTHVPYKVATQYIKTFGKFIRELDMQLYSPISADICRKYLSCFKVCVNTLIKDKCKLQKLSLPCLYLERGKWGPCKDVIVKCLSNFFCKGQTSLTSVNLQSARMEFNDAYKVLFALAYNLGDYIEELDIEDFVSDRQPLYEFSQFKDCMKYFKNLNEICINYSYISDEIVTVLSQNIHPNSLKKIFIRVSWQDPYVHPIYDQSWKKLTDRCPDLNIYVYFLRILSYDAHLKVLQPQMPVRQVTQTTNYLLVCTI